MRGAAHFVLNREQVLAISRVDDVAKPVLVLVVFLEIRPRSDRRR